MGLATYPESSISDNTDKLEYRPADKPAYFPLLYIFASLHLLGILGVILFPPTWQTLIAFVLIANFFGLGITLGFHRCLTHRSFAFKSKWVERAVATIGTINYQQGPIWWCSIHRLHHKYSDSSQDPHNSRLGFLYSHITWLFHLDPKFHPLRKRESYPNNVKDISSDPYYRWLDKLCLFPLPIYLFLLLLAGGWYWFFWGGVLPILYNYHVTYSVNSVSHLFGYRSFGTKPLLDQSKNNFLVGTLALGEGWHNNHHAFPSSPKHGFFQWWEFDFTYLVILLLKKLGLVENLKTPSPVQIQAALPKTKSPEAQIATPS
jgi:stearoyl-CoA desaturase (delta-9 desaturase)